MIFKFICKAYYQVLCTEYTKGIFGEKIRLSEQTVNSFQYWFKLIFNNIKKQNKWYWKFVCKLYINIKKVITEFYNLIDQLCIIRIK